MLQLNFWCYQKRVLFGTILCAACSTTNHCYFVQTIYNSLISINFRALDPAGLHLTTLDGSTPHVPISVYMPFAADNTIHPSPKCSPVTSHTNAVQQNKSRDHTSLLCFLDTESIQEGHVTRGTHVDWPVKDTW